MTYIFCSFFRYSDIYKCSKGGNCVISLKTRKNCQFCRFAACEKAGMKRSWVLADGESNKCKKNMSNVPTSPNLVTSTTSMMPNSSSTMCSVLSSKDESKIRDCIQKMEMIKQQTEDLNPQVSFKMSYSAHFCVLLRTFAHFCALLRSFAYFCALCDVFSFVE